MIRASKFAAIVLLPLLASVLCGRVAAAEPQTKIECELRDAKWTPYTYSFLFDPVKGTLTWLNGGEELKTERHTSTELLVSRRGKFGATSAQIAYFDLALVQGGATMRYFRDPTAAEIAKCEAEQSAPDCTVPVALPQYEEGGYCTFEEQPAK